MARHPCGFRATRCRCARIRWTGDYSGHADYGELAGWIRARQPIAAGLFLLHGEEHAIAALAERLRDQIRRPGGIMRPLLDDVYDLTPAGAVARMPQPSRRIAPERVSRMDWHNERSRLLLEISDRLGSATDDRARVDLIQRLRKTMAGAIRQAERVADTALPPV